MQSITFCPRPPKFMSFLHGKHIHSIPMVIVGRQPDMIREVGEGLGWCLHLSRCLLILYEFHIGYSPGMWSKNIDNGLAKPASSKMRES